MQSNEMLKGLRVVELASVLAGPAVGQFFAECGAEVIKVENPLTGGDVTRTWKGAGENLGDRSAYFYSVNWGKKSITVDLGDSGQRDKLIGLLQTADVVLASYKPGDAEKLGVDYASLKASKHDLIYGSVSGYGSSNRRVGYDAVIQAESGFMDLNGEPDGAPLKLPVALMDLLAAHQLKEGLLLALLRRQQTGEGSQVEVSLLESAIASLANQASNYLVGGKSPGRLGSLHPNIAPYGEVVICKDGKPILLAVGNDKQFRQLCTLLHIPQWADDPHFSTNTARLANRKRLSKDLQEAFSRVNAADILPGLHGSNVPAGQIQTVREALTPALLAEMGLSAGKHTGLRTLVARINGDRLGRTSLSEPPGLGQHNAEFGF